MKIALLIEALRSEYDRMYYKYESAFGSYLPNTISKNSSIHPLPNTKK